MKGELDLGHRKIGNTIHLIANSALPPFNITIALEKKIAKMKKNIFINIRLKSQNTMFPSTSSG